VAVGVVRVGGDAVVGVEPVEGLLPVAGGGLGVAVRCSGAGWVLMPSRPQLGLAWSRV
jgi:hypothetical protein